MTGFGLMQWVTVKCVTWVSLRLAFSFSLPRVGQYSRQRLPCRPEPLSEDSGGQSHGNGDGQACEPPLLLGLFRPPPLHDLAHPVWLDMVCGLHTSHPCVDSPSPSTWSFSRLPLLPVPSPQWMTSFYLRNLGSSLSPSSYQSPRTACLLPKPNTSPSSKLLPLCRMPRWLLYPCLLFPPIHSP